MILRYLIFNFFICFCVFVNFADAKNSDEFRYDSFEDDSFDKNLWKVSGNARVHVSNDVAREGSKSLKFQIFHEDKIGYRDELTVKGWKIRHMEMGEDWWYGFSLHIPEDFKPDSGSGDIIFQIHASKDKKGKDGATCTDGAANPLFVIAVKGEKISLRHLWGDEECTTHKNWKFKIKKNLVEKAIPGKWYDFVIHFKMSNQEGVGETEVWVDGKKMYEELARPNSFKDKKGPYMKFGIYKSMWGKNKNSYKYINESKQKGIKSRTYYHDNMRIYKGEDGYDLVKPKPL